MTFVMQPISGLVAYDMMFEEHLATAAPIDQDTMHRALRNSEYVWLCMQDTKIICVWGLIAPTLLSDRAYLWMYTTKHMQEHIFIFVRHSQRALEAALERYPIIVGHTLITNAKAIRWLKWLGAKFEDPQGQALPFYITRKSWPQV